jgi:hypothetical protein
MNQEEINDELTKFADNLDQLLSLGNMLDSDDKLTSNFFFEYNQISLFILLISHLKRLNLLWKSLSQLMDPNNLY